MWIQSKISYEQLVDGEPKQVTESYLHDAVSFADAEVQCFEHLKARINELDVTALSRVKIGRTDVLFFAFQEGDSFWKVKTKYQTETFTGKAKTVYQSFILPAIDDREASERVRAEVASSLVAYEIINVDVTPIRAVYMPHNEIWEGDWKNRMDDLDAQGKRSSHHNQLDLFDGNNEDGDMGGPVSESSGQDLRDKFNQAGLAVDVKDREGNWKPLSTGNSDQKYPAKATKKARDITWQKGEPA